MRRLKYHCKSSASFKNNNNPSASLSLSPTVSPGGLSSMRVTVTKEGKPSPEWRRRKKVLRFRQFLEVGVDVVFYFYLLFQTLIAF